jgi:hypothetical protein
MALSEMFSRISLVPGNFSTQYAEGKIVDPFSTTWRLARFFVKQGGSNAFRLLWAEITESEPM